MANDLNKVMLIGRLTRDPEFKSIKGSSVANFSLANNRSYTANNEKKEETHFFDCEVWGKLAEIIRDYGKKGKQIAVEGRLTQSSWDTPDGKKSQQSTNSSGNIPTSWRKRRIPWSPQWQ